jgi:hypothetical protein
MRARAPVHLAVELTAARLGPSPRVHSPTDSKSLNALCRGGSSGATVAAFEGDVGKQQPFRGAWHLWGSPEYTARRLDVGGGAELERSERAVICRRSRRGEENVML